MSRATGNGQLAIAAFNDQTINRNTTLTAQHAADITRDVLLNNPLQASLGIDGFRDKIAQSANGIVRSQGLDNGTEIDDALMDRSFYITLFRSDDENSDANKAIAKEILKLIGGQEEKLSFALCQSGQINVRQGRNRQGQITQFGSAEGDTHWTSLHVRKTPPEPEISGKLEFFHANSIGNHIPEGIKGILRILDGIQITQPIRYEEARDFLVENNFFEIEGDVNNTQHSIITGLMALKNGHFTLPDEIKPVACANQGSDDSGFGNTCCENSIFNMFSMHYDDQLHLSRNAQPSIGSEHPGSKQDAWNNFIRSGRGRLNEIIQQRRGVAVENPQEAASDFAHKLSEIDNARITTPQDSIAQVQELLSLKSEIIMHISDPGFDQGKLETAHKTLDYNSQSLQDKLTNLCKFILEISPNPETYAEQLSNQLDAYNDTPGHKNQAEIANRIITLAQQSLSQLEGPEPEPEPVPVPIDPAQPIFTPTAPLSNIEEIILSPLSSSSAPGAIAAAFNPRSDPQTLAQDILRRTSATASNDPLSEEFLRPRTYSGIGADTSVVYKNGRFEFKIEKIYTDGLAQNLDIKKGDLITYEGANTFEELNQAISAIRKIASQADKASEKIGFKTGGVGYTMNTPDVNAPPFIRFAQYSTGPVVKNEPNRVLIHGEKTYGNSNKFIAAIKVTQQRIVSRPEVLPSQPSRSPSPTKPAKPLSPPIEVALAG